MESGMRRLLIYLTYDPQNVIDDYIGYFLKSMKQITDSIAVICNMSHIEKGLQNISAYTDKIFYRQNIGLDAGGFKDALCSFIGWEHIAQYDEIILANDSFYGPFVEISNIFTEMESRNVDFWGLMKRGAGAYGTTGSDPEHILSFFYVFQAPLIHSGAFRSYWEEMPYFRDYMTVVKQYERQLTIHFASLGYTYDVYSDTSINESRNLKNQFFQCDYLSYEMIVKRNFPFLKKKQMSYNTLYYQTQENVALSIDYIDQYICYDADLIWKNLIRTHHHTNLQRSLGLQYILEESKEIYRWENVLVLVGVQWSNAVESVCEYLERVREVCKVQVVSDKESLLASYREKGYDCIFSGITSFDMMRLADTDKFQYICMIHDADLSSDQMPSCTGKSYFFNVWENLIKNAAYLNAVINLLEKKFYIGMLMHPMPIFSVYIGKIGFEWEKQYEIVQGYIDQLKLKAVTDVDIPPINVTDNFWVKAEVLDNLIKKLDLGVNITKIPGEVQDYLWNYIVQDSMKLTGIVESVFYAAMNETNYQYYLRTFINWMSHRYGQHLNLYEYEELFQMQMAVEACRKAHEIWYVYGTGELTERCYEWIKDAAAFVVSDGQRKEDSFHGKPVRYLSELNPKDAFGVLLCLSKENQNNVIELLRQRGIHDYYTVY